MGIVLIVEALSCDYCFVVESYVLGICVGRNEDLKLLFGDGYM